MYRQIISQTKLNRFFILGLIISSVFWGYRCNNLTERERIQNQMIDYEKKYYENLQRLITWLKNIQSDSDFVIEYSIRANEVSYYYYSSAQHGVYFGNKKFLNETIKNMFYELGVVSIRVYKNRSYAVMRNNQFYEKAGIILCYDEFEETKFPIDLVGLSKKIATADNKEWVFHQRPNSKIVFVSLEVLKSL